jgi:hypothetical protein
MSETRTGQRRQTVRKCFRVKMVGMAWFSGFGSTPEKTAEWLSNIKYTTVAGFLCSQK